MNLLEDVKYVKGVGPNRVKLLNKIGIFTLKDLITYYPRGYEDRSNPKNIEECVNGETVLIEAFAVSTFINTRISGGRTMQRLSVEDETGRATITWFNQPYLKSKFQMGKKYRFYGRVEVQYGKVRNDITCF